MSANSSIEWTDHTFNPWEGCQKVGPGCDHCYAETRNARFGGGVAVNWGPGAPRRRTSVSNWSLPKRWNAQADAFFAEHGRRQRVFCASLADVFDNAVDPAWRADLLALIRATPNLDWLLLTKRIGNVKAMLEAAIGGGWWASDWPNVWIGATVVNQAEADRDIPKLLAMPAAVRFLSIEPLLGRIDLCEALGIWWNQTMDAFESTSDRMNPGGLDWVIVGGESGPGARPMHPDWVRSLRDTCAGAGVPFLFKQWGEWQVASIANGHHDSDMARNRCVWLDINGTTTSPSSIGLTNAYAMARVGKKAAGRLFDGRTHDGFPGAAS